MKNVIKKFAVLLFSLLLCLAPTAEALAATVPVLVIDLPELGVKVYDYRTIEKNDGVSTALYDPTTSDQTITVPAGKSFELQIVANNNANLQVTIFGQTLYYNEVITTPSGSIIVNLPVNSYDERYHIWLNARTYDVTLYNFTSIIK